MTDQVFDKDRLLPLLHEVESARSELSHGIGLILTDGQNEPSPIFSSLATGVEKLLKLSIGLLHWEEHQTWPTKQVMQIELRHDILKMHVRVLKDLARRLADPATAGSARKAMLGLRGEVVNDPAATLTLRLLGEYAIQGRFHNLDTLAGHEPAGPSPAERWSDLQRGLINEIPDAKAVIGTPRWSTDGQPLINEHIHDAMLRWWRLHQRSWNTGVFGRVAQMWSSYLGHP